MEGQGVNYKRKYRGVLLLLKRQILDPHCREDDYQMSVAHYVCAWHCAQLSDGKIDGKPYVKRFIHKAATFHLSVCKCGYANRTHCEDNILNNDKVHFYHL